MVAQEPLQLTSRCDDNVPWYGGVAIANDTFGGVAGDNHDLDGHCSPFVSVQSKQSAPAGAPPSLRRA
ncbi:hypothetical protein GCM10010176_066120 [Nonomuraea spiralis]|nr:hypothetical protein GCM10010176_066120 [Nonomuraea spiralis]